MNGCPEPQRNHDPSLGVLETVGTDAPKKVCILYFLKLDPQLIHSMLKAEFQKFTL